MLASCRVLFDLARMCRSFCIDLVPVLEVTPRVTLDDVTEMYALFEHFLAAFEPVRCASLAIRLYM